MNFYLFRLFITVHYSVEHVYQYQRVIFINNIASQDTFDNWFAISFCVIFSVVVRRIAGHILFSQVINQVITEL